MKGIKELFLGVILTILIGAGFGLEVNAGTLSYSNKAWTYSIATSDFDSTQKNFEFEWDSSTFSPAVTSFTTIKDGSDYKINGEIVTEPFAPIQIASVTSEDIKNNMTSGGLVTLMLKEKGSTIPSVGDKFGVYVISTSAISTSGPITSGVTISPNTTTVLAGEQVNFTEASGSSSYAFSNWTMGTGDANITNSNNPTCQVTVPNTSTTYQQTLVANYTVVPYTLQDVFANEGLSIPFSSFVNGDSYMISQPDQIPTNIRISGGTFPTLARILTVYGVSPTKKTLVGALKIDNQTVNVTVFPRPQLSIEESGSGANTKLIFDVIMPYANYNGADNGEIDYARIRFEGERGTWETKKINLKEYKTGYTKTQNSDVTIDIKKMREVLNKICKNDDEDIEVFVYDLDDEEIISKSEELTVHKIKLDGSGGADYKIMGESVGESFYAIDGLTYDITATPRSGYSNTIEKWEGTSFGTSASGSISFDEHKTIKAIFKPTATPTPTPTPSPSPTPSNRSGENSGMDGYDDVPKTGESKADIWILWSVLFVSILGAGFMIWKRFGLVRAIAEADEEVAVAEHKEEVKAKKKEKEDKIKMLKDLRNL